jgi:hypothetical protein
MNIGNLNGAQYGGAQAVQRSFATLAQSGRTLYDAFTRNPGQCVDLYPWNDEAYTFDPPLHELSNANLQLVDEVGAAYSQLDNLNIVGMNLLNGRHFGKVKFFVSSNTAPMTTLTDANVFYSKDMRVGDEIVFYLPAITQIASDPTAAGPLTGFFQTFSNNYIVTDVLSNDFSTTAVLPTSGYATSFNAVPKIQTTIMGNLYATLSSLVNSPNSNIYLRSYDGHSKTLSQEYVIPVLNKSLQATFALEIITQEPDASKITKMIPAVE